MAESQIVALTEALIFTGDAFVENHALLMQGGKVTDLVASHKLPAGAIITPLPGQILAPGFIDCQVNGGGNLQFNNGPTGAMGVAIAKAHHQRGTTRVLLTCISERADLTQQAITSAREARQQHKGILGLHLEGPHLASEKRGAHEGSRIRPLSEVDMKLYQRQGDEVMLLTVAPETVLPEQIKQLCSQGMHVMLGHTGATPEQIRGALAAGATGFTHIYNAMGSLSARQPGPAGIALDDRNSWCSLIADGFHVSPEMIRLALRAKPPGKVFLVSDAMAPAGTDKPQPFKLYGEDIRIDGKRCLNRENGLVGSMQTLSDAVQHCVNSVGVEPAEALRMASTYPANFLGLDAQLGKLLPGFLADVVALDKQLQVKAVWVEGVRH